MPLQLLAILITLYSALIKMFHCLKQIAQSVDGVISFEINMPLPFTSK